MTVPEFLFSVGVYYKTVKRPSGSQAIYPCPNCGSKDKFSVNLDTGAYSCLRLNDCGIKGSFRELQQMYGKEPKVLQSYADKLYSTPKTYTKPSVKLSTLTDEAVRYLNKRGISAETAEHFKLGVKSGTKFNWLSFPYYKNNELVAVKYRSLVGKEFLKEKNCISVLWNQDNIEGEQLIIQEGELEPISLYELMGIDSVSIPSGVSDLTWIENDWEFLERFNDIVLMLDSDEAGQGMATKLIERLGKWRCRNVILPYKDMNECLVNGLSKYDIQNLIDNAVNYGMAELKNPSDFAEEIIERKNNPELMLGKPTSNYLLDNLLGGWRNNELTIWSGYNNSGKSTMLSQEICHWLKSGEKVCIGSFEMPPRRYLWWMLQQYLKQSESNITDSIARETLKSLSGRLFIIDICDNIDKTLLLDVMNYAFRKYGVNIYVVDSMMKVNLTTNSAMILGEQKKFVSELKDFANKNGSHIHLVAHPRKGANDNDVAGKMDVAGSADITNLADNVIVVQRIYEKTVGCDAILHLKKNREKGDIGEIKFAFNPVTRIYTLEDAIAKQIREVDF